jgi:hypothetical protein
MAIFYATLSVDDVVVRDLAPIEPTPKVAVYEVEAADAQQAYDAAVARWQDEQRLPTHPGNVLLVDATRRRLVR